MIKFKGRRQKQAGGGAKVTLQINRAQIEQLRELGTLTAEQAASGLQAGGMLVTLPAHLVAEFQANPELEGKATTESELEALAQRIDEAGLSGPTRLLLISGRPLSFVSSQFLLMLEPLAGLGFGQAGQTLVGRYSRLLENRANLDQLLQHLDELEAHK